MGATFTQSNFLGGEWSPYAQGRFDLPEYRGAMNVCLNVIPIEAGAAIRRPGTIFAATTLNGQPGCLREFHFSENAPYTLEFTNGALRFFAGISLCLENSVYAITDLSTADPAEITLGSAAAWNTGDQIELHSPSGVITPGTYPVFARQWAVTKIDTTHFTLADPITGVGLDGSTITGGSGLTAARVLTFVTPYIGSSWETLRVVQSSTTALILNGAYPPSAVVSTGPEVGGNFATFTFETDQLFIDGPYLDPPTDLSTLTPSALTGTVTLTASAITSINAGAGFQATDVGRLVRLFSEPPLWLTGTSYAKGDIVKYGGVYWTSQTSGSGHLPGGDPTSWFINPYGAIWTWATIATVVSTTQVTATLAAADPNQVLAGGPLLYTTPITTWQLGLYSNTTSWPTGGCYFEGRFYLFGAVKNRFDASVANSTRGALDFAGTDYYGNVSDANALDETAETDDTNTIFWMQPVSDGIAIGTEDGEFALSASSLGDPITPTSIQCHRVSKYKCANAESRWTGLSMVFIQAYQRNLMEFVQDPFTRKHIGFNLSERARHLTTPKLAEIAYQYELNPTVWGRCNDGSLIGCTYKRVSPYGTQGPAFYGWHRHKLGSGRLVESLRSGPSPDGALDTLALITNDPKTGIRYVEFLSKNFDETDTLLQANFVDAGASPSAAQYIPGTPDVVRLYGLQYIAGDTVTVWGAGLDLGDYVVSATGTIDLPVGVAGSLFTPALLASLTAIGDAGGVRIAPATGYSTDFGAINEIHETYGGNLIANWNTGIGLVTKAGVGLEVVNINTGALLTTYLDATMTGQVNCFALDADNNFYWAGGGGNSDQLEKVSVSADGTSVTHVATFGVATSSFTTVATVHGIPGHMLAPYSMTCLRATVDGAVRNYLLSSSFVGPLGNIGSAQIDLMDTSAMNYTGQSYIVDPGIITSGSTTRMALTRSSGTSGVVFGCNGDLTSNGVRLYSFTVTQAALGGPLLTGALVNTILPTDIAADWTSVDALYSAALDETDGNVIIGVTTSTGTPAYKGYLLKISTGSGQIMWSMTALGAAASAGTSGSTGLILGTIPDQNWFQFSHVSNGRASMMSLEGGSHAGPGCIIDTLGGTVVSKTSLPSWFPSSYSMCDGSTGTFLNIGNFDNAFGPPPAQFGTTPSSFSSWGAFYSTTPGVGPNGPYYTPFSVGFTYTSQGQILRAIDPQEAGSRNGPALGKKRRNHQIAVLFANAQQVSLGTLFTDLQPANFKGPDDYTTLPLTSLFSGVYWNTLDDENTFDGMLCWQISRPYPATVCAIQGFLATKDT